MLKLIRTGTIAAMAVAVFISGGIVPAAYAAAPVVSFSFPASEPIKAPLQKPLWTASYDKNANNVVTDDGILFTFSGGKLIALDVNTGKKLFTYGNKLRPGAAYLKGVVYGVTESGQVYAVNVKTGKGLWQTSAGVSNDITPSIFSDTLYVTKDNAIIALEASTGKQRWKSIEENSDFSGGVARESDGIVYAIYMVQGALTTVQLDAIDKKTGKKLWEHIRQNAPLAVQNGLVYSVVDEYPFDDADPKRELNISVIDAKTGTIKEKQTYSWKLVSTPPYSRDSAGSVILDGKDLYLATDSAVLKYDIAAYEKDGKPLQKWTKYSAGSSLIGSMQAGRIFFANHSTGRITGMKLVGGQSISFLTDNQPVQTDIYGNGVYIGQSDGVFHGYNLQTTAPAFTVNTGSRNYGQTLRSGNTLIIQARDTGKLIAVPVPKALL
ncbi:PQQ-like beta-propeller repeat protein [Paenibacillus sp. KQZ6P-2]|uniref:PQQ-like beta-propeller repeat protein n=1 Tax=Paenibacillus mangrovi TaxID=2931978 RepID=A0A9X1WNV8_9BACL|nr:PQQ-binding-like beta-propeller repeat protein [Paenibacillus mangrovi]MCJ8011951.1 PQQ-like beta-propeller repeat protein [Paenibacillus mangrovi]